MDATDFFQQHVVPAIDHWRQAPSELWRAMIAIVNLNQLADYRAHDLGGDVRSLRNELVERCADFQTIWDVADAHKHRKLRNSERTLASAGAVSVVSLGYSEAEFGLDEWGSPPQIVVYRDETPGPRLGPAIESVMAMWLAELNIE